MLGRNYYPKLQSCVPFSPVTGARLLVRAGPMRTAVTRALAKTLQQIADELGARKGVGGTDVRAEQSLATRDSAACQSEFMLGVSCPRSTWGQQFSELVIVPHV